MRLTPEVQRQVTETTARIREVTANIEALVEEMRFEREAREAAAAADGIDAPEAARRRVRSMLVEMGAFPPRTER